MVQSNDLVQVDVENLNHVCDPQLFNYGKMRDGCTHFSYTFTAGQSYGLIADCGAGGWTISYVLAGRTQPIEGIIKLNNLIADTTVLKKYSCYIGDDLGYRTKKILQLKPLTIRQHIQEGLKKNPLHSFQEIVEKFELTSTRLDRPIHLISNERWDASAAIGFAHGKKIYCFPWLNKKWIKRLEVRIENIIRNVKSIGGIVIIPTSQAEYVQHLVDQTVDIPGTFF